MTYNEYLDRLKVLAVPNLEPRNDFISQMLRNDYIRRGLVNELIGYNYLTQPQINILLNKRIGEYI